MTGDLEAGFAKLQGEDFEYYMQTYSIVLGRNSKKSAVDVDLAGLGGGMNISRQHARIFYDFDSKRFALEVLGKNGCHVEGVLHHPGALPVKLESQFLLQIGDKKFYFLLPIRNILRHPPVTTTPPALHGYASSMLTQSSLVMPTIAPIPLPLPVNAPASLPMHLPPTIPGASSRKRSSSSKPPTATAISGLSSLMLKSQDFFQQSVAKKPRGHKKHETKSSASWLSHDSTPAFVMPNTHNRQNMIFHVEPKAEVCRPPAATAAEASPMQAEEKEIVSAVATVLSDSCGPGEWMPMPDLHSELFDHYSSIWPSQRVRKFLTSDDLDGDNKTRPWAGLLALLRKYSEHFVITTRTKGRITSEFVSLVSLLS